MTTGPYYECPWCSNIAVYLSTLVSVGPHDPIMECKSCGSAWMTSKAYKDDVASWKAGKAAGAAMAATEEPDYITSGELQADVENLMRHAEAEAVQAAMTAFTEELEAEARDIFKSGDRSDIVAYKLYDLVVGRAQSARRMFGGEY